MTTAEQFRAAASRSNPHEVLIAGVPWPTYKVVALLLGVLTLAGVGLVTATAGAAVLSAAAVSTAVWIIAGAAQHRH